MSLWKDRNSPRYRRFTDQTNAWFVGYGKKDGYNDLAIAVVVEDSGAGSTYAVPVDKKGI